MGEAWARHAEQTRAARTRSERRCESRLPVRRHATLIDGTTALPCVIEEFSARGFFIVSKREFSVGQILELKCELYPSRVLLCKIEIRHIRKTRLGAAILEVDEDGTALLDLYLQECHSASPDPAS